MGEAISLRYDWTGSPQNSAGFTSERLTSSCADDRELTLVAIRQRNLPPRYQPPEFWHKTTRYNETQLVVYIYYLGGSVRVSGARTIHANGGGRAENRRDNRRGLYKIVIPGISVQMSGLLKLSGGVSDNAELHQDFRTAYHRTMVGICIMTLLTLYIVIYLIIIYYLHISPYI